MTVRAVFLDDGGVMNDNERRAAEWRRLIGEYLTPRLGATQRAWEEANATVFDRQWQRFEAWRRTIPPDAYDDFFNSRAERTRWLREMCEHAGIEPPPDDQCYSLAIETEQYVMPQVRAAYPGAVDAIRTLASRGYLLATASGQASWELVDYLSGMGILDCFEDDRLFGPDLVQRMKGTLPYYERIMARTGVDPAEALVVDDEPHALEQALAAGVRGVLVTRERAPAPRGAVSVPALAQLPCLLESMG